MYGEGFVVRKAKEKDLKIINELTDVMHVDLADLYELKFSTEELEEEHYDEDELDEIIVAEDAEKGVLGYMSFSKGEDEWVGKHYELEHIVVHEDYRGLGAGKKLFNKLFEKAKKEGVNITTGTLARNYGALKFYQKLGFKPLSIRLLLDLQGSMRARD